MRATQRRLVLAGAVNVLASMLYGLPYTVVIIRDYAKTWSEAEQRAIHPVLTWIIERNLVEGTERAWKMAHLEGLLNGFMCWLICALIPALKLNRADLDRLAWNVAATAYGNTVASGIAAIYGVRGFVLGGSLPNVVTCALFGLSVCTVFRALQLLIKGSLGDDDEDGAAKRQQ